jgi:hypothetical protein
MPFMSNHVIYVKSCHHSCCPLCHSCQNSCSLVTKCVIIGILYKVWEGQKVVSRPSADSFAKIIGKSFVGKSFVGKSFVGKSFVGKSFVGKSFVGKSFVGKSFVGKSFLGILFQGKTFLGKNSLGE